MEYKGEIVNTVEDYEAKQKEIAEAENIVGRYAGREKKGVIYPDIKLNDGRFFIPYEKGKDTINKEDIFQEL